MKILLSIAFVAVSGCATSSGVLKTGDDSYTVSASASLGGGGASAAKKSAFTQANQQCSTRGQQIAGVSEKASAPSWTDGMYTVDVSFSCR